MITYRTTRSSEWHDDRRGFYIIPAGAPCKAIRKITKAEAHHINKAKAQGVRLIMVNLKGRRRLVKRDMLGAYSS